MARANPPKREAGFTLVETMIAMFFIAFIVAEMAMVSVYSSRSSQFSRRINEANHLASQLADAARNTAYPNLQSALTYRVTDPANGAIANVTETCTLAGTAVTCTASVLQFTQTRTVTPLPSGTAFAASESVDVDITVAWTDARGQAQQVRVATVVSKWF